MGNKFIDSSVPVLRKSDFDDVATEFLQKYYPEALDKPMPVPIENIAGKMGLFVCKDYRLTEDFSVYGQICFSSGIVDVYDKDEDEYREKFFRRGTILVDPDTILERNIGCFNNTVAHECVHWFKHRLYHFYNIGARNNIAVSARHFVRTQDESLKSTWSDEDWMEWQANGIAPRILMPRDTFIKKFNQLKTSCSKLAKMIIQLWIYDNLANFFKVSKKSVEIRIEELGLSLA